MDLFEKEIKQFDKDIKAARQIARNTVYRLIVLSAGIVAFSFSLFSIQTLNDNLDLDRIRISWYLFVGVILVGIMILFMEGRTRHAKTWKVLQISIYPDREDYTAKEKWLGYLITMWSLIYPSNLVFNKVARIPNREEFERRVNGLVVRNLAGIEKTLLATLDNIFLLLFVVALVFLVSALKS